MAIKSFLSEGGFSVGSVGSTPIDVIDSSGNITATALTLSGNLIVNGTTLTLNSTTTTLDDPIITLGGDTAPTVNDSKDRGVEFRWHNGTVAKVGFFGYDTSTGYLTFIPDATNTSEVFSGTQGDIQATNFRGNLIGNVTGSGTSTFAGNVGIGTASAVQSLTISGASGGPLTSGTSADGALRVTASAFDMVLDLGLNNGVAGWLQVRNKTAYSANYALALNPNGGNVGIGTATGLTEKLHVSGNIVSQDTATSGAYYFNSAGHGLRRVSGTNTVELLTTSGNLYLSANGPGSNQVTVLNGGNVGIGTTAPFYKVGINTLAAAGPYGNSIAWHQHNNNNPFVGISFDDTNDGLSFNASVGIAGFNRQYLFINRNTGNVGIGTTSPGSKLHIQTASSGLTSTVAGLNIESNTHQYIQMFSPVNTQQGLLIGGGAASNEGGILWEDGTRGNYLSLIAGSSERLVILGSNGNVGIGVPNPLTNLQIGKATVTFPTLGTASGNLSLTNNSTALWGMYVGLDGSGSGWIQQMRNDSAIAYNLALNPLGGNVGIGTTAPITTLQVGSVSSGNVRVDSNGAARGYYQSEAAPRWELGRDTLTSGGHLIFSLGGSPQQTFGSGIGIPTNNAIALYTSNGSALTERVRVDNLGQVGIGWTTPYSTLTVGSNDSTAVITPGGNNTHLTLKTVGAGGAIRFFATGGTTSNVAATESMRVDAGGNVGIGTVSPAYKLDVNGTLNVAGNFSGTTGSYSSYLTLGSLVVNDPGAAYYAFGSRIGGTVGISQGVSIGSGGAAAPANGLLVGGNVGIGITSPTATLHVSKAVTADWLAKFVNTGTNPYGIYVDTSANAGTEYTFAAYTNAGTGLLLRNNGNLGVGTASPTSKLSVVTGGVDISGTANANSYLLEVKGTAASGGFLPYGNNVQLKAYSGLVNALSVGSAYFSNIPSDGSALFAGNVGIGTINPLTPLQVNGSVGIYNGASGNVGGVTIIPSNGDTLFTNNSPGAYGDYGMRFKTMQSTGGSQYNDALYLKYNGNVGIGTISPFSKTTITRAATATVSTADASNTAALTIAGTGDLVRLQMGVGTSAMNYGGWIQASYDNGAGGNGVEPLLLNPIGGNVGIGTTNPSRPLEVKGTGAWFTEATGVGIIELKPSTTLHQIFSNYNSGSDIPLVLGTWANKTNQLYLATTGNVGIGTTIPAAKLGLTTLSATAQQIIMTNGQDNAGDYQEIKFQYSQSSAVVATAMRSIRAVTSNYGAHLAFLTENTAGTFAERMRIDSQGVVSISSTAAGSAGAGALVVTGGLATGAASFFGGSIDSTRTSAGNYLNVGTTNAESGFTLSRSGAIKWYLANTNATDNLYIYSTAAGTVLTFAQTTGAATFAGTGAFGGAGTLGSTYLSRLSVFTAGAGNFSVGGQTNTNNTVVARMTAYNASNANSVNESATAFMGIASIESVVKTATSNAGGDSGGDLVFLTKGDGGTLTERMRLLSTGAATFSGAVTSTDSVTSRSGVTGSILRGHTGGGAGALYSTNVSPGAQNYTLYFDGSSSAYLNAATTSGLAAGGILVAAATSTGLAVTGTVTAPSLTSPASTNLTLAAGGTNQSVILTPSGTGGVGIGTITPGAKLEIVGTPSTLALSFGSSVPNNPLYINTYGGFTGIGMDQSTAGLRLVGDNGGNALVDVGYYSSNVIAHANWISRMRVRGNGDVSLSSTSASSSAVTGALQVAGGIGVAGGIFAASYNLSSQLQMANNGVNMLQVRNPTASSVGIILAEGSQTAAWISSGTSVFFDSTSGPINFRAGGTTTLTLAPTTLAATFAGAVTSTGNLTVSGTSGITATSSAAQTATPTVMLSLTAHSGVSNGNGAQINLGNQSNAGDYVGASMFSSMTNGTPGGEHSSLVFQSKAAGALVTALTLAGANATFAGAVTIAGNLTVNGTTTTVNSTTVTVDDPIITLGGDTVPTVDDNKDRGVEFRWHNGTVGKVGFFGFDDSTGYLTFIPDATNTSEIFSGSVGDIQAANFRGNLIGNATGYSKWIDRVPEYQWNNSTLPTGYNSGVETSFVSAAQGWPNYGVVLSVMGRVPADPGGNFQLYMGHGASYGGLGLRVRSVNQTGNVWTSWKTLIDSENYTSYPDATKLPLAGGTLTGELVINYASGRQRITDGTNTLVMGMWDGSNVRIESSGRPLYMVSYGGAITIGRSSGSNLVIDTSSLTFGGNFAVSGTGTSSHGGTGAINTFGSTSNLSSIDGGIGSTAAFTSSGVYYAAAFLQGSSNRGIAGRTNNFNAGTSTGGNWGIDATATGASFGAGTNGTASGGTIAFTAPTTVSLLATSASSSAVTGALQVAGGIGVGAASYFGGSVTLPATESLIFGSTFGTGTLTVKNGATGILTLSANTGIVATNYGFAAPAGTVNAVAFGIGNSAAVGLGMYSPSANALGFVTNATERLTISSTGAATFAGAVTATRYLARASGISLSSGNSSQLEISNAASGACNISFHRESAYGAHFGLDTDNWFSTLGWSAGAGYTAMRVGAFTANGALSVESTNGSIRVRKVGDSGTSVVETGRFVIGTSTDGTFVTTAANRFTFATRWTDSTEFTTAAIQAQHQTSWGGGLTFLTKPSDGNSGGSLISRMVITPEGNVGIGTTSPLGTLDIGKGNASPSLVIGNSNYPSQYNSVWGCKAGLNL